LQGEASVTLTAPTGHTIRMHPLEFGAGGEASSWLVTASDIRPFDQVTIRSASGSVLGTATVRGD
jgi:hypothetical protein